MSASVSEPVKKDFVVDSCDFRHLEINSVWTSVDDWSQFSAEKREIETKKKLVYSFHHHFLLWTKKKKSGKQFIWHLWTSRNRHLLSVMTVQSFIGEHYLIHSALSHVFCFLLFLAFIYVLRLICYYTRNDDIFSTGK